MDELDRLVERVLASPKYQSVCRDLVRAIGARELVRRRTLKAAVKATRNGLHRVAGAYLCPRPRYGAWLEELAAAYGSGEEALVRQVCRRVMGQHASSRERLPFLEEFYAATLGPLGPVRSVLDLACGLNPLAIPWMPLAAGAEYHACDVYHDMAGFLGAFLRLAGVGGGVEVCDLVQRCPAQRVDVALILKTVPCLEQIDPSAGRRLLEGVNAAHLLVSFPTQSLCGGEKGMVASYGAHFQELVAGRGWRVRRFEFPTELAFLVSR